MCFRIQSTNVKNWGCLGLVNSKDQAMNASLDTSIDLLMFEKGEAWNWHCIEEISFALNIVQGIEKGMFL